ncbi:MAG: LytTR family DNA-binding domain-containing protein [Glycocaulis sp.]
MAGIVAAGSFLAVLGPYGTDRFGWPLVWFYWTGLMAMSMAIAWTVGPLSRRLFPRAPDYVHYAVVAFGISIAGTAAVLAINGVVRGQTDWSSAPVIWLLVFILAAFISAMSWLLEYVRGLRAASSLSARAIPAGMGAALTEKLPHRLRSARLISMSSEDHYLRVRTDAGEALILMRLSDAVAACSALNGAQVHRSWWVARSAVSDARKGDGRGTLVLENGTEVPVSRSYYPALRDAGWF